MHNIVRSKTAYNKLHLFHLTSTIHAIVDAVPMVLHVPVERLIPHSASKNSAWEMVPLLRWACIFHIDVPEPITLPR